MSNSRGYEQQKRWRSNPDNHRKYLAYLAKWRSDHQEQIKAYRAAVRVRKEATVEIASSSSSKT